MGHKSSTDQMLSKPPALYLDDEVQRVKYRCFQRQFGHALPLDAIAQDNRRLISPLEVMQRRLSAGNPALEHWQGNHFFTDAIVVPVMYELNELYGLKVLRVPNIVKTFSDLINLESSEYIEFLDNLRTKNDGVIIDIDMVYEKNFNLDQHRKVRNGVWQFLAENNTDTLDEYNSLQKSMGFSNSEGGIQNKLTLCATTDIQVLGICSMQDCTARSAANIDPRFVPETEHYFIGVADDVN